MSYIPLPEWCKEYSNVKLDKVTGQELFCICKKPDNGELMVGCDGCDDWFHFDCVKVPKQYRALVASFYCPYCQAGITGKSVEKPWENHPVPKTMWKRKCRVQDCYSPCNENSKYCSEEHGKKYMRDMVDRVQLMQKNDSLVNKNILLQQLLNLSENDIEKFNSIGEPDFIYSDVNKELNNDLHDELIVNDVRLKDLETQLSDNSEKVLPAIENKIKVLDDYLAWLKIVINKIMGMDETKTQEEDQGTNTKKKRKTTKNKPSPGKRLCGYTSNPSKHPTLEEFMDLYIPEDKSTLGICTASRCQKHHDWSKMFVDQYEQEKRSTEAFNEKLKYLIQMRKKQLHIQYYEKSLKQ